MTVSATELFEAKKLEHSAANATPAQTSSYALLTSLTHETRAEVERLTHALFLTKEGETRRSVLLGEIGDGPTSSRWLAAGVGAAMAARGRSVHILFLGAAPSPTLSLDQFSLRRQQTPDYFLEYFDRNSGTEHFGDAIEKRLADLRSAGDLVILHTDNLLHYPEILSLADQLDGVALIVRASHTRRAAIEAVRAQMTAAEIPLLGAVLLDRIFPIPEKLYRLL